MYLIVESKEPMISEDCAPMFVSSPIHYLFHLCEAAGFRDDIFLLRTCVAVFEGTMLSWHDL